MGKILTLAAYAAYAAFWLRFIAHALVWRTAAQRPEAHATPPSRSQMTVCVLTAADVLLFARLLNVNPSLWLGEWTFHASILLVLLRHLRYFLDPVPAWVWCAQTPGLIAGYFLPLASAYILAVRLLTRHEKYAAPANLFLLALVLAIGLIGVIMHAIFKPDLVAVKLFILGIMRFEPAAAPDSMLFLLHFSMILILAFVLPTHLVTAPLVMREARKREMALHLVMHEEEKDI